ncbi:hypothetical protein ACLBOM_37495 [Escherichia coli]
MVKNPVHPGHLDGHPNGWFNDFRDGGSEINATWSLQAVKNQIRWPPCISKPSVPRRPRTGQNNPPPA